MIYSPRPFNNKSVCTKFVNGSKELSICCDDSCGVLKELTRSDIMLFTAEEGDVTEKVFGSGTVHASIENFAEAFEWLRKED